MMTAITTHGLGPSCATYVDARHPWMLYMQFLQLYLPSGWMIILVPHVANTSVWRVPVPI